MGRALPSVSSDASEWREASDARLERAVRDAVFETHVARGRGLAGVLLATGLSAVLAVVELIHASSHTGAHGVRGELAAIDSGARRGVFARSGPSTASFRSRRWRG